MICFPNSKLNIGLFVTGRREDGYHNLETVFYPLAVNDVLEVVAAPVTRLSITGIPISGEQDTNLVWKAYQNLSAMFPGKIPAMEIYLHKLIPMGAGLGGGSADGAFMLKLMNDFCGLGLSASELAILALQLGSDCPFFIYNEPVFASGRGEVFESLHLDLSGYTIVLAYPVIHVSTARAFSLLTPKPASFDLRNIASIPVQDWKQVIQNDFEEAVFSMHPEIGDVKEELYRAGAIYASMSGSGSAVYGIFRKGTSIKFNFPEKIKTWTIDAQVQ